MPALAIWTPEDALLGAMAPLGLAMAAPGPALVVDLDEEGPDYFGAMSLADLAAEGPRRPDLTPSGRGVAILRNGGIAASAAIDLVQHFIVGWPSVVLRLPEPTPVLDVPLVSVIPLLPIAVATPATRLVVYQDAGWLRPPPSSGPVLPMPRRRTWDALANGRTPAGDRWLRALRRVWAWA